MLKILAGATCALALSGSLALAQNIIPSGPNNAPYGANGAAPVRDVGGPTGTVNDTATGRTQSTSILSETNKRQSAAGASRSDYYSGAQSWSQTQAYGAPSRINRSSFRSVTDCLNAAARVHAPLDNCER
jgi:hypothetical protein